MTRTETHTECKSDLQNCIAKRTAWADCETEYTSCVARLKSQSESELITEVQEVQLDCGPDPIVLTPIYPDTKWGRLH